jgi:hypothetical protein
MPPKKSGVKRKTKKPVVTDVTQITAEELFQKLNAYKDHLEKDNILLEEEQKRNSKDLEVNTDYDYLYPHPDDKLFNEKIMRKKEFYDIMYTKEKHNVREYSDQICKQQIFELMPHQLFVRNYLSFNTPYNSLLLFHGLGTGKTCSAITVTEMMRTYLKQLGISKRIIIVASPNVQTNFKIQLFNEQKLEFINGVWNLNACTGNKFLKEINPMNMRGLKKKEVVRLIKRIINQSYLFMGPEQFANYIHNISKKHTDEKIKIKLLKKEFSNRMIVIDEVHNIRNIKDIPNKKISKNLLYLVSNVDNLKLLLLTATPMFNTNDEIVWLLNLMNLNDKRPLLKYADIFDSNNDLKIDPIGEETGKNLLIQKSRSYVSYLRGENPYTFPFKITHRTPGFMKDGMVEYTKPRVQMNDAVILEHLQFLDLCITVISPEQQTLYAKIVSKVKTDVPDLKSGLGYQLLSLPIQALTMFYPSEEFDKSIKPGDEADTDIDYKTMVGKLGLQRVMSYNKVTKRNFEYKQSIREKYGRIFDKDNIQTYSSKINFICNRILNSEGIVLIYSQYIDGGCLPMALALEERGFSRYGKSNNLFNSKPTEPIDSLTFSNIDVDNNASYAMITGDALLSPNNETEINALTDPNNQNGEKIKVVIISEAGSEGIDLSYIRQVHIIDPWFNLGRIEQIIGRAVRNCSHKLLPFEKRNVEIYMHATQLITTEEESADMYVYRTAEQKAIKIGRITRILKENAIDCVINRDIATLNQTERITLSTNDTKINYRIGDKESSYVCDYMKDCNYDCNMNKDWDATISHETYDETYITLNIDIIINKIKTLFSEGYCYKKNDIIKRINHIKNYPGIQIDSALSRLVNDNSEYVFDNYRNRGKVINIGQYYLFNPINIDSKHISSYERMVISPKSKKNIQILLNKDVLQDKTEVSKLLVEYEKQFNKTFKTHKEEIKEQKNLDWYKAAGNFFIERNIIENLDRKLFNVFVVKHMVDSMELEHKVKLLNYIYINKPANDFEKYLLDAFNSMLINSKYIVLGNHAINELEIYTLNKDASDNVIVEATPVEKKKILKIIIKEYHDTTVKKINILSGFMGIFKKKYVIFKIKDASNSRDIGSRPDQKGKQYILKMLNTLINVESKSKEDVYTYENTNDIGNSRELCIDQEIFFRYYDHKATLGKRWFLSYEESVLNKKLYKK